MHRCRVCHERLSSRRRSTTLIFTRTRAAWACTMTFFSATRSTAPNSPYASARPHITITRCGWLTPTRPVVLRLPVPSAGCPTLPSGPGPVRRAADGELLRFRGVAVHRYRRVQGLPEGRQDRQPHGDPRYGPRPRAVRSACSADSGHLSARLGWCGAAAESFALALDAAVAHLHDACGGYWPGVSPDYIVGMPGML